MPAIFYHNKFTCIVNYLLRSFVNYVSWNKSPSLSFHTKQKGFLKVQTLTIKSTCISCAGQSISMLHASWGICIFKFYVNNWCQNESKEVIAKTTTVMNYFFNGDGHHTWLSTCYTKLDVLKLQNTKLILQDTRIVVSCYIVATHSC